MKASDFGDFFWGAATSAYQIEGAWQTDGKGPSIWDDFTHRGKVKKKQNGDTACDHYRLWRRDLELLRQSGLNSYRFSVAWSRIMPEGRGRVNMTGLDFYRRWIDHLLEAGITPFVTLYHWDLPSALQRNGGWANRDIADWFLEYSAVCARAFSPAVKNYIVLNEPMIFNTLGYLLGVHAPGKRGWKNFIPAVHYSHLAQAKVARHLRSEVPGAVIGSSQALIHFEPASASERDAAAVVRARSFLSDFYLQPLFQGTYPAALPRKIRQRLEKIMKPGEDESLRFDYDFIGVNHYTRMLIRSNRAVPAVGFRPLPPPKNAELTAMKWEVFPPGLREVITWLHRNYSPRRILVTENGMATRESSVGAATDDQQRIRYFRGYLEELLKAKQEGAPVSGYFIWSLLDNFEWAEGYHPRFGTIHVDYNTMKRTPKASFHWVREFLRG